LNDTVENTMFITKGDDTVWFDWYKDCWL